MPRMLRKSSEPPKLKVKDYGIDVDAKVKEILEEYAKENKKVKTETSEDDDDLQVEDLEDSEHGIDPKKADSAFFGTTKTKTSKK